MFDQLVQTITDYPYIGVALVFLLCGLGLPLPEEIVLLAGGFVCAKYPEKAQLLPMMGWCAGAILVGDMIPFLLGRIFGVRLLRVRWLRYFITKQRLAVFDRWFRRRGDLVIVISRFVPGLRVVAFFTAGAMKMRIARFLLLDGIGIALIVPLLTWIGFRSKDFIDEAIEKVTTVERGILWGALIGGGVLALVFWWHRRRRQKGQRKKLGETYVQPKRPVQGPPSEAGGPTPAELAERADLDDAEARAATPERPLEAPRSTEPSPKTLGPIAQGPDGEEQDGPDADGEAAGQEPEANAPRATAPDRPTPAEKAGDEEAADQPTPHQPTPHRPTPRHTAADEPTAEEPAATEEGAPPRDRADANGPTRRDPSSD